ncbi:MAG: thiamine diphosphokinase [Candidatus Marinimicrobia bacterium]|nr:thiamine diphosphokinase [Candidatus Neomarinimicrobiota bacterium]
MVHILLVLAGDPPGSELLEESIRHGDVIIGVDGGGNVLKNLDYEPDVIIGDLDSFTGNPDRTPHLLKRIDQDKTDLQKALDYISEQYQVKKITILGGTGGRADHLLNNLQICAQIDSRIEIVFKHDGNMQTGYTREDIIRITPHSQPELKVNCGETISLLQTTDFAGLTSSGLKWEWDHIDSGMGFISQSNKVIRDNPTITLKTGSVYIAAYK